ncbi:MAG: hypothetical protein JSS35_14825, partial [Proteobacteria bacterium]|nr:hypothetical protein [Pseudomonadota bacterium]
SANLLRETLTFFLGQAAPEDLKIFAVQGFEGEELKVEPVDLRGAARHEQVAAEGAQSDLADRGAATVLNEAAPASAISWLQRCLDRRLTAIGPIEVQMVEEPIWNVRARAITSIFLRTELRRIDEPMLIPAAEAPPLASADATLSALDLVLSADAAGRPRRMGFHVPLPANALVFSQTRYRLLRALQDLDPNVRRRVILEIVGVEDGFPLGRLRELTGMIAPYGRAVLLRAASERTNPRHWRNCGASAVTLGCWGLEVAERSMMQRLAAFAEGAAKSGMASIAYGIESRALMLAAWGAGFTHVAGSALCIDRPPPRFPIRIGPEEFYAVGSAGPAGWPSDDLAPAAFRL